MSRTRNIKPAFFTNDVLAECSALARLLFVGLWTIADREGRLEDRPKKIKAEVLPYDDCLAEDLLAELVSQKFIVRYEVNQNKYIQITNFRKHQKPHPNEQPSTIPAQDGSISKVETPSNQGDTNSGLPPLPYNSNLTPPNPPRPEGEGVLKNGKGYRVDHHLNDDGIAKARSVAKGWDIHYLMRVYDGGVAERGIPNNPNKAFPAWCAKYTKGKQP